MTFEWVLTRPVGIETISRTTAFVKCLDPFMSVMVHTSVGVDKVGFNNDLYITGSMPAVLIDDMLRQAWELEETTIYLRETRWDGSSPLHFMPYVQSVMRDDFSPQQFRLARMAQWMSNLVDVANSIPNDSISAVTVEDAVQDIDGTENAYYSMLWGKLNLARTDASTEMSGFHLSNAEHRYRVFIEELS